MGLVTSGMNAEHALSVNQYRVSHSEAYIVITKSIRVRRGSRRKADMGGTQIKLPGHKPINIVRRISILHLSKFLLVPFSKFRAM